MDFAIADIVIGERLRQLDEANVQALMVVIGESGFVGAILVRPIPSSDGKVRAQLVAGRHRLEAMRRLGFETIPSDLRRMDDDEALQIEIDENLVRKGVTPLERAEMVLARFDVWARRFPDRVARDEAAPKRGPRFNSDKLSQLDGTMGFAEDTAASLGVNPKTVRRAWAAVNGIAPELRQRLHGTWVAKNDAALRQLAMVADRGEQTKVVEQLLGGVKNFSDARALANGNMPARKAETPLGELTKALDAVWNKATPSQRDGLLHHMAGGKLPKGWIVRKAAGDA